MGYRTYYKKASTFSSCWKALLPPASFIRAEITTRLFCVTSKEARSHVNSVARSHRISCSETTCSTCDWQGVTAGCEIRVGCQDSSYWLRGCVTASVAVTAKRVCLGTVMGVAQEPDCRRDCVSDSAGCDSAGCDRTGCDSTGCTAW